MAEFDDVSAGDDLLRWCSESGGGTWSSLRDAAAYVSATRRVRKRPWELAVDLSRLGHLDIDWNAGRWSVAPACLALSPGMGLCAYLAGWRPESLIERFRAQREDLHVYPFDIAQGSASTAMFAKCDGIERIHQIADELNLPIVFDPSAQLAELVEVISVEGLTLGAPPPFEETLRFFDPESLAWSQSASRNDPGLYEFELHGRREHRLLIEGDWRIVDRSTGQLILLRGREDLVRWHKPPSDMSQPSAFVHRETLAMPQIVERCLASASGLLPVTHKGVRVYRNVSHEVAAQLADRLGCPLEVQNDPMIAPYGGQL